MPRKKDVKQKKTNDHFTKLIFNDVILYSVEQRNDGGMYHVAKVFYFTQSPFSAYVRLVYIKQVFIKII